MISDPLGFVSCTLLHFIYILQHGSTETRKRHSALSDSVDVMTDIYYMIYTHSSWVSPSIRYYYLPASIPARECETMLEVPDPVLRKVNADRLVLRRMSRLEVQFV